MQVDSIIAQSDRDWALVIRDDGSTDNTEEIIGNYCALDSRISQYFDNEAETIGPKASFGKLIHSSLSADCEFIFLCDQDDFWFPEKLKKLINPLRKTITPFLVYSDVELVDDQLRPLTNKASFRAGNVHRPPELNDLLSLNTIPGCSIAFNRRLAELATPMPDACIMHDWWLALTAAAVGGIVYVDEPLVSYRQHQANVIGGKSLLNLITRFTQWPELWRTGSVEHAATLKQSQELAARLSLMRGGYESEVGILHQYSELWKNNRWQRLKIARKLKLRWGQPLQRMVLYLRLLGRLTQPRP